MTRKHINIKGSANHLALCLEFVPLKFNLINLGFTGDQIEVNCEVIPQQGRTCEIPHHSELPNNLKGMYYRANLRRRYRHWGKPELVNLVLNIAYNWWRNGNTPRCLITDLSVKVFKDTDGHKSHKSGEDADFDLARTLPRDPNYNVAKQQKCTTFIAICLAAGAKRVLFSDPNVVRAVNTWAQQNGIQGRARTDSGHDNHFHVDI